MPDVHEISLDAYVARLRDELETFAANWSAQNRVNPEEWPAFLSVADWDEQFLSATLS